MQQLRFLTKRSYLNDRFQAQAYLKVNYYITNCMKMTSQYFRHNLEYHRQTLKL